MKYPTQTFNGKEYRLYRGERYFSRGAKRLHRVVWEHYHGEIPKGMHIHHKDGDPTNNHIDNLEMKTAHSHLSEHMTPEHRERQREWIEKIRPLASAYWRSEKGRRQKSEIATAAYKKRKPVKRSCAHCHSVYETTKYSKTARFCHQNCKMKARRRRLQGLPEDALIA